MSNDFTTTIPIEAVEEGVLTQLVGNLAAVTGQPVAVKKQYLLSTPSTDVALLLDGLRDSLKAAPAARKAKKEAAPRVARARRVLKQAEATAKAKAKLPPQDFKARYESGYYYRNLSNGELISIRELPGLLASHKIPVQTCLAHVRKGTFVIVEADDPEAAYLLIKEPKP